MSTSEPTISVITVCYNSAATLAEALQSVADQSWPHIEHIVIDGASKDDTAAILERFHSHLACIVSEPDKGIYDAMNKGVARATGDIVCFLNADDAYASKHVLADVAQQMEAQQLDALLGDVSFYHPKNPARVVRRYRADRFTPSRLAYGWMPAHPSLFMRRAIYQQVGKFRIDYRIAGDFEFIVRAFSKNTLRYEHKAEVLVNMRTGGASTAGLRAKVLLNREVLRACRENGIQTSIWKILSKYPFKLLEMIGL